VKETEPVAQIVVGVVADMETVAGKIGLTIIVTSLEAVVVVRQGG